MAVAVPPPCPMGGAGMGPRGFCGSPGWELELVQPWDSAVPQVPSQLLAWSLLPVPGMAGVAIPCTQGTGDHDTSDPREGHEVGASPASAPALGLGVALAPLLCLQPQKDRIPGEPWAL